MITRVNYFVVCCEMGTRASCMCQYDTFLWLTHALMSKLNGNFLQCNLILTLTGTFLSWQFLCPMLKIRLLTYKDHYSMGPWFRLSRNSLIDVPFSVNNSHKIIRRYPDKWPRLFLSCDGFMLQWISGSKLYQFDSRRMFLFYPQI